jgi:hypothetical protein
MVCVEGRRDDSFNQSDLRSSSENCSRSVRDPDVENCHGARGCANSVCGDN